MVRANVSLKPLTTSRRSPDTFGINGLPMGGGVGEESLNNPLP